MFKHAMNADIEFYEIYNSMEINMMMNGHSISMLINKINFNHYLMPFRLVLQNLTSFYTLYLLNATVTWFLAILIPIYGI